MEWKVDTHIAFARRPTSAATRSRISAAALLVNVMARICPGCAPWASCQAMRWVSTRVLPEPAPATMSSGEPECTTASRCCGFMPSSSASACSRRRSARRPAAASSGAASAPGGLRSGRRSVPGGVRTGAPQRGGAGGAREPCRQPGRRAGPGRAGRTPAGPVSVLLIAWSRYPPPPTVRGLSGRSRRPVGTSGAGPGAPSGAVAWGARAGSTLSDRAGDTAISLRVPAPGARGRQLLSRCPPPAPESEDPGAFSCRGPDGSDPSEDHRRDRHPDLDRHPDRRRPGPDRDHDPEPPPGVCPPTSRPPPRTRSRTCGSRSTPSTPRSCASSSAAPRSPSGSGSPG